MSQLLWVLWALLLAGYVVIATKTWRRAAWVYADKARFDSHERFTTFEIIWGLLVGAVFASIWPITLAVYAVKTQGLPLLGNRFLLPPTQIRLERQAQQAEQQEQRIAELERQTRIR